MSILINIGISFAIMLGTAFGVYNYVPIQFIEGLSVDRAPFVGATITTIQGTDRLTDSRTVINDNFSNLNAFKIENSSTTINAVTTLSNLATVGTITSGTWNGTALTVTYGGTGSTTLSSNQLLLGNGTSQIANVVGFGTSGQFLTSNGNATAPTWQTSSVSQTIDYNFTGSAFRVLNLHASSTSANPLVLNKISYAFPAISGASSTVLSTDGSGNLSWNYSGYTLLFSTTTEQNMAFATTSTFAAMNTLRVLIDSRGISSASALRMYFNSDAVNANYGSKGFTDYNYATGFGNENAG